MQILSSCMSELCFGVFFAIDLVLTCLLSAFYGKVNAFIENLRALYFLH